MCYHEQKAENIPPQTSSCPARCATPRSQANPTPGPWTTTLAVQRNTDFAEHIKVKADNDWTMAEVRHWHHHEGGPEMAEANARLIAAAPDLLEACEAALPALSAHEQTGCDCPDSEAARLIRAAIAKVKGG